MDLAAMCNLASESVRTAIKLNDDLHLELAHQRVKEHWPTARTWSRQWVAYDDMPGGDWYLTDVKDADGQQLRKLDDDSQDSMINEIDEILSSIREDADYNLTENTITIE